MTVVVVKTTIGLGEMQAKGMRMLEVGCRKCALSAEKAARDGTARYPKHSNR